MVATVEGLKLTIDASGMEAGARVAIKATDDITKSEKDASTAVDEVNTRGTKSAETMRTKVAPASKEVARSFDEVAEHGERVHKNLLSVDGIGERVSHTFEHLAKAAVSFIAVDVVAKVFGFRSAMDALDKATEALAKGIEHVLNPQMDAMIERAKAAADAFDKLRKAHESVVSAGEANIFKVSGFNQELEVPFSTFSTGNLDKTQSSTQSRIYYLEQLKKYPDLFEQATQKLIEFQDAIDKTQALNEKAVEPGLLHSLEQGGPSGVIKGIEDRQKALDALAKSTDELILKEYALARQRDYLEKHHPTAASGLTDEERIRFEYALRAAQATGKQTDPRVYSAARTGEDWAHFPADQIYGDQMDAFQNEVRQAGGRDYGLHTRQTDLTKMLAQMNEITAESLRVKQIADDVGSAFSSAFEDAIIGAKSFGDALRSLVQDIERSVIHNLLAKPFGDWISGLVSGAAGFGGASTNPSIVSPVGEHVYGRGAMFSGGSVVPFANGGIFGSPTFFPMSGGRTGMLGESGPEAIIPLKPGRDGKLGISSEGRAIVMNITTHDADSFGRSSRQIMHNLHRLGG